MSKYEKEAINRIIEHVGAERILEVLSEEISLSDLNSLLLDIFRNRTSKSAPSDLLKRYTANRFVQPAAINPIKLKQLELDVLKMAESLSFFPLQLSPAAPLGACSIIAPVNQNKVISALRGTEIVADSTNSLALFICEKLKKGELNNTSDFLRFSSSQRIVRAQAFSKPGLVPHFHLFCLVTSGRDRGSYYFEKQALMEQLVFYQEVFHSFLKAEIIIRLINSKGYKDSEGLILRITDEIKNKASHINIESISEIGDHSYYQGLQFKVIMKVNGQEIPIGDGGFVDWSQKLLGNKKERMLISGIGLDRLLQM